MTKTEWSDAIRKIVEPPKVPRHRHERTSWVVCGGHAEWCYQCGAWRPLKIVLGKCGTIPGPEGKWQKPTGIGGPNPAMTR